MVNELEKPIRKAGSSTPVELPEGLTPHVQVHHEDIEHGAVGETLEGTGASIVGPATPPQTEDSGRIQLPQESLRLAPDKSYPTDDPKRYGGFVGLLRKLRIAKRGGLKNAA